MKNYQVITIADHTPRVKFRAMRLGLWGWGYGVRVFGLGLRG